MIECAPTASVVIGRAAFPPLRATGPPRSVAPSLNCTVPVAVLGVTVAVSVTDCPTVDGFGEELATTPDVAAEIVWIKAGDVLGASFVSPP